ncbi:MAG: lipid-A-disaccharide synthase [Gammaproteobacteria bacterium]|nr:lipid-A-disaccharide synthase [Gammaproteobacteria bacterium]
MKLMNIGIVAGEASGDLLGANLLNALRLFDSDLIATGLGGPAMINAGFSSQHDMERLSVMGLVEPLLHLPDLFKLRRQLLKHFLQHPPHVFIGIDSPDFNLGLELKLKRANIPIVHYVSPSVWAWRRNRIHKIAKATDMVLTLFPFEADFYRKHRVPVQFVGHPLADTIPLKIDLAAARRELNIPEKGTYIALLPGSRKHELKYLAELFVATAKQCLHKRTELHFITSAANAKRDEEFQAFVKHFAPDLPIHFFVGRSHDVIAAADIVLVTSGTATLETLLFKKPMIIAYRMSPITFSIARRLVKLSYIGLPNLLADECIVPEFIQNNATPENLCDALLDYLDHPEKMDLLKEKFNLIHQQLRCNASQQAALAIKNLITQ